MTDRSTTCAVIGGGPAGVMTALLLARAGVDVVLVEKHDDFIRDFRGDTVHPSTIRLLDELGLGDEFRALPQSRLDGLRIPTDDQGGTVVLGDLMRLRAPYNYVAMVPQWDLLNLLVEAAEREASFEILRGTTATDVIRDRHGVIVGVQLVDRDGTPFDLDAALVIACDGRTSVLREASGLPNAEFRVGFDTWWFRVPTPDGSAQTALMPRIRNRDVLVSFPRRDYEQVAFFARKGTDDALRAAGVDRFRERIAALEPGFGDRLDAVQSMDDVHHLDVRMTRLRRWWSPGLLLIGDAAHAMSPLGGVGINLAIQDAVAAAMLVAAPLRRGLRGAALSRALAAVQRRRLPSAAIVQRVQRILHRQVMEAAFDGKLVGRAPRIAIVIAQRVPFARFIVARGIGFGPRPEHAPGFARRDVTH